MDREPFYEIEGIACKGATIMTVTNKDENRDEPPRCRTIKLSIRDFSKQLCKISRVAITHIPTREEEEHKT